MKIILLGLGLMRSVQDAELPLSNGGGADLFSIVGVMLVDELIKGSVGIEPGLAVQGVDDGAAVGFGYGTLH